jgi:hypothetical protein
MGMQRGIVDNMTFLSVALVVDRLALPTEASSRLDVPCVHLHLKQEHYADQRDSSKPD